MQTQIINAAGMEKAAALLHAGELVVFPTETVYGLGADGRSDAAVRKIYEAKGRPAGNPLIVHVHDAAAARDIVAAGGWTAHAGALAVAFWPGPLTMVLPRRAGVVSPAVSAGRGSVAVRCPDHPVARGLLKAFDGPVAAPSANRSGFTSPTTAAHVLAELDGRVPLVIDGGACRIGLESTVVDLCGAVPRILRPGAVTAEMIRGVIGAVETVQATVAEGDSAASPGQHARHYAPRTPAFRFVGEAWTEVQKRIAGPSVLITWSDSIRLPAPHETLRLSSEAGDYARDLYAALHQADDKKLLAIYVLLPPSASGLWAAVADRVMRATVPVAG